MTNKRLSELEIAPELQGDERLYLARDGKAYQVTIAALAVPLGAELRLGGAPFLVVDTPTEGEVLTIEHGVWTPVPRERITDGGTF